MNCIEIIKGKGVLQLNRKMLGSTFLRGAWCPGPPRLPGPHWPAPVQLSLLVVSGVAAMCPGGFSEEG